MAACWSSSRAGNRRSGSASLGGSSTSPLVDIDQDGDSDLVATTAGRRHIRLLVWTNAGRGRLVTRVPLRRPLAAVPGGARFRVPIDIPVLDDLSDGPDSVVTLPPLQGGHGAVSRRAAFGRQRRSPAPARTSCGGRRAGRPLAGSSHNGISIQ